MAADVEPGAYLAEGFRDVDSSGELGKFVSCLEYMDSLEVFQEYKNHILHEVGVSDGMLALDVGCGVGFDVVRLAAAVGASGRAVGIDPSKSLIGAADKSASLSGSNISYVVGVGEHLGFRDGVFDIARIDRSLQHIADPKRVIGEMYRVLKSGGRIACAEPDWGTFTLTSRDRATTRVVKEAWADSFRNGWIGRWLKPYLVGAGFKDVRLTGYVLLVESLEAINTVFDLLETVQRLTSNTSIGALDEWIGELSNESTLAGVTIFIATGRK